MKPSENPHHRLPNQPLDGVPSPSPLGSITISDYLRNLANQTVIQTQRTELLARIRDNPDDNSARIGYAEHLENNPLTIRDKARAELIRLQVARGESQASPREREILTRFERDWMRDLGHVRGVTWDRGFVTAVTMAPRHFAQGQETLALEPITHLRIHLPGGSEEGGNDLRAALRAPNFRSVERLSFWIASPPTLLEIEAALNSENVKLREIHFERFAGSVQEILETCSRVSYPTENTLLTPVTLALGDIKVTFGEIR